MKTIRCVVKCLLAIVAAVLPACVRQDEGQSKPVEEEEDRGPIDVRRELERRVRFDFGQTDINTAIENVLGFSRLRLYRQFFVESIPQETINLKVNNVTIKKILDDLVSRSHLSWTIRAESVFVGTRDQVGDIEDITRALERVDSPILRKQLDKKLSFCTVAGTPLSDILRLFGEHYGISFVVRGPVNDNAQRFGSFDFCRGISMRNLLRFLAVNWGLDLVVEKDSVVFVPRKPAPPPAPAR